MFIDFFYHLRQYQLPVSVKEFLCLLEALRQPVMAPTLDDFYYLARTTLIKDESLFDRYDQAFASFYQNVQAQFPESKEIPMEWLIKEFERHLSPEEKASIEKLGLDRLLQLFEERLAEQKERHAGGNKWIGTGGSSPFGHSGFHPEGIRVGGPSAGNRTAVKVWQERQFKEYDHQQDITRRNIQVALRRLRRFAREGSPDLLDLDNTISHTARNAGLLNLQMVAEKRNRVKVIMLLDVGGSMDDHIYRVQELFAAARYEFQYLEVYYFHNCPYERLWRYNNQKRREYINTTDFLHTYNNDWNCIFVGDATMSPYEVMYPGGSVEHHNELAGAVWLERIISQFPKSVWLNPEPSAYWQYRQSIGLIQNLIQNRMYGTTLEGLEQAMRFLSKK